MPKLQVKTPFGEGLPPVWNPLPRATENSRLQSESPRPHFLTAAGQRNTQLPNGTHKERVSRWFLSVRRQPPPQSINLITFLY